MEEKKKVRWLEKKIRCEMSITTTCYIENILLAFCYHHNLILVREHINSASKIILKLRTQLYLHGVPYKYSLKHISCKIKTHSKPISKEKHL